MQRIEIATRWRGIEVGGVRMAIEVPPEHPWTWMPSPLVRFLSPSEDADLRVSVRVGRPDAPAPESLRYDSGGGIFDVARDGEAFVIALRVRGRLERVARFDPSFREGEVVIHPDSIYARELQYPLAYPLDEVVYLHRIVRLGGLLIHACGIVRGAHALVFTGPSGAGKTTISRLMQRHAGARVLSDDRIVLRPSERGIRIHGTPWHGDGELSEAGEAELRAVHLIRHAREVIAEPLAGARAAAGLLGNAFLPAHDPVGAAAALEVAAALVERVPVIRLGFPKDERVVRYAFGSSVVRPRASGVMGTASP